MITWWLMSDEERFETLQNMEDYGGSFAGHIARAWRIADSSNTKLLAETFDHLVKRYHPSKWSRPCAA